MVLILLIGFSRIFLGVHYVTDVIGGFLVGGFWLLVGFIDCRMECIGRSYNLSEDTTFPLNHSPKTMAIGDGSNGFSPCALGS